MLGTAFLAAVGYGFALIRRRDRLRHISFLEAMLDSLRRIQVQTVTLLLPLPEQIFSEASRQTAASAYFRMVWKRYQSGVPFRQSWEASVQQIGELSADNASILILLPLGEILGSCAAETQSDAIQYATDALRNRTDILKTEAVRRSHLELRLFPCFALTVAFLLWR